jgi:hypothetical protein
MSGIIAESIMLLEVTGEVQDESGRRIYLPHNVLVTGYRLAVGGYSNDKDTITSLYRETGVSNELLFSATIEAGSGVSTIHTQGFNDSEWGDINVIRADQGDLLVLYMGYSGSGADVTDMVAAISYTGTWR